MANGELLVSRFLKRKFANVRERLNTERFHFMPLNLEAFKVALSTSLEDPAEVSTLFNGVVEFLKSKHTNLIPVSGISKLTKNALKGKPSLVYQGSQSNIVGAIYQGYNAAYEASFRQYLNNVITSTIRTPFGNTITQSSPTDLLSDVKYAKTKYKKGFDVGHMYAGAASGFGDTPLSYKLRILQEAVNNLSNNKLVLAKRSGVTEGSTRQAELDNISAKITLALQDLETKSNLGIQVTTHLSKSLTNSLSKVGAVIILPQGRIENQLEYGNLVESAIEREISELLKTIRFSPNLIEDSINRVKSKLTGIPVPNSISSLTVNRVKVKSPVKTKVVTSVSKAAKIVVKVPEQQTSRVNLSSLLALINSNLQNVISANMGGGTEKGVLNYRSGRFAGSAKVERLSESRAGMITAFYSYMKNPYQTFEPGFAQGSPASRNPKNLIGTSIREIAATKVANQLRAVSI